MHHPILRINFLLKYSISIFYWSCRIWDGWYNNWTRPPHFYLPAFQVCVSDCHMTNLPPQKKHSLASLTCMHPTKGFQRSQNLPQKTRRSSSHQMLGPTFRNPKHREKPWTRPRLRFVCMGFFTGKRASWTNGSRICRGSNQPLVVFFRRLFFF